MRKFLSGKIHRVRVTGAELHYVGSVAIGRDLLAAANIAPNELVEVVNLNTGDRWETYALAVEEPGAFLLNGGGARLGLPGDVCIVMTYWYGQPGEAPLPAIAFCNERNELVPSP